MPDASHDKLSYSRQALEKVRAKYDKLSKEQLLDLVCELTRTYVVEQTIPFDIPIPEREAEAREGAPRTRPAAPERQAREREDALPDDLGQPDREPGPSEARAPHERFAQLVNALKRRADLPQLEHFAVEEGRVVLRVDNQKVTFGERTTVEFVPSQGRPRRPSGERPAASAEPAPSPGAPAPPPAPSAPAAATPPGARPGLPGGDGRTRQGSQAAGPFAAPPRPAPGAPAPAPRPGSAPAAKPGEKPADKSESDLSDVNHIVERFKRLDLD